MRWTGVVAAVVVVWRFLAADFFSPQDRPLLLLGAFAIFLIIRPRMFASKTWRRA